jgi:hypothetical protein
MRPPPGQIAQGFGFYQPGWRATAAATPRSGLLVGRFTF